MNIDDFEKIEEVEGQRDAQRLIDKGWKLLASSGGQADDGTAYILYSFGKPKASI